MSRNPFQTCPFDGTRGTPGAETRPAGKPVGGFRRQNDRGNVFGKKFQRERKTALKPPRKDFCTGIFSYEPRNKNSKPRKKNSGARNFAFRPRNFPSDCPKSKIHRQNLAQKPRFVQKNRAKIRYLGRIAQKSRHENQPKRNNLSVFTSILWHSDFCRRCGIPAAQSQDRSLASPADTLRVYQNKLLRLVGEVARSDGGVSRP